MEPRKNPLARRYKFEEIAGHSILIIVTEDIQDEYLQAHFDLGWNTQDYEYCQAIKVEADRRGIEIVVP